MKKVLGILFVLLLILTACSEEQATDDGEFYEPQFGEEENVESDQGDIVEETEEKDPIETDSAEPAPTETVTTEEPEVETTDLEQIKNLEVYSGDRSTVSLTAGTLKINVANSSNSPVIGDATEKAAVISAWTEEVIPLLKDDVTKIDITIEHYGRALLDVNKIEEDIVYGVSMKYFPSTYIMDQLQ